MEERHRRILTRCRAKIVRDLRVAYVIDTLIAENIITVPEKNEIMQKHTREEQTAELLDILPSRGQSAHHVFCNVLREVYPHLADELEAADVSTERVQPVQREAADSSEGGRHPGSSSDESSDDESASDEKKGLPLWEQLSIYMGYRPAKDATLITGLISLLTTVERALLVCLIAIDIVNWVHNDRCSLEGILKSIVLPLILHPNHNFLLFPVLASWFIAEKLDYLRDVTKFIKKTKDALREGQEGGPTARELRKAMERQRRYMKSVADALLLLVFLQSLALFHAYYEHVYTGMQFRINISDEANVNGALFCVGLFDVLLKVFVYVRYYHGRNPEMLLERFDVR
ncbi:uncharacterized protein LOC144872976 [Branchiostoma floridae x Branchiostoma japonicum]